MSYRSAGTIEGPLHLNARTTPGLSAVSEGRIYFDTALQRFVASENGGAYSPLATAASSTLSTVLSAGNTSGANNILMTAGQQIDSATAAVLNLGNTNATALGIGNPSGGTSAFQIFVNQGGASFSSNAGFQLSSTTSNRAAARFNQFGANTGVPGFVGFKSRGTNVADLASVADGDILARMTAIGVTGDNTNVPLAGFVDIRVPTGGTNATWVATDFSVSLVPLAGPINSNRQVSRITSEAAFELIDGTTAPVSPASVGQIRYNNTTKTFQTSVDGGAWTSLGGTYPVAPSGGIYTTAAAGASAVALGDAASAAVASSIAVGATAVVTAGATARSIVIGQGASFSAAGGGVVVGGTAAATTVTGTVIVGLGASAAASDCVVIGSGATAPTGASSNNTVVGANATATGAGAGTAVGGLSVAGLDATALGAVANASATDSVALGRGATINATSTSGSVAIGRSATFTATGGGVIVGTPGSVAFTSVVAIGLGATSTGNFSTAVGTGATAGNSGTAVGRVASAGSTDVAYGHGAAASGGSSIALGVNCSAGHANAIVIGRAATSTASNQMVVGAASEAITTVAIGQGVSSSAPSALVTWRTTDATAASAAAGSSLTLRAGNGDGAGANGTLLLSDGTGGTGGGSVTFTTAGVADRLVVTAAGLIAVAGTTASFPALKRSGTELQTRLADDSDGGDFSMRGERVQRRAVSANVTLDAFNSLVGADSSGGGFTITLPTAASAGSGRILYIKDEGGTAAANNITIDGNGAETIDGAATYVMTVNYEAVQLYCDGSNWFLI